MSGGVEPYFDFNWIPNLLLKINSITKFMYKTFALQLYVKILGGLDHYEAAGYLGSCVTFCTLLGDTNHHLKK